MATIRKRGDFSWHAQVRRKGFPTQTKTFETRRDAEAWARTIERDLDRGLYIPRADAEKTTLADVIKRYRAEILPSKKGAEQDAYRLDRIGAEFGRYSLAAITPALIAEFRDRRLKTAGGTTVIHDLGILTRLFKAASMDFGIHLPGGIPTALVRKPKAGRARDRRLKLGEYKALLRALTGDKRINPYILPALKISIRTAMRRGELLSLEWEQVDLERRVALLRDTKNGESRAVPLSSRAAAVFADLRRRKVGDGDDEPTGRIFPITPNALKHAWMRATKRAGIADLRWHDLRHEAASRLFERGLDMMEVASITGHKTLQMLKRYTHLRAEDLAKKLG